MLGIFFNVLSCLSTKSFLNVFISSLKCCPMALCSLPSHAPELEEMMGWGCNSKSTVLQVFRGFCVLDLKMNNAYALKNLVQKSPFPCCFKVKKELGCLLTSPVRGIAWLRLLSLFSHTHTCVWTVHSEISQRADALRTASDWENAMWGDVERSWGMHRAPTQEQPMQAV